ncbi:AAA family ATPase [Methanocella sp. MCL-LM]|uniref:AAA family ATPase n=1 Tax=Methanocella sp. MCL-LM TaxID=3412035 RepID=UPI003C75E942
MVDIQAKAIEQELYDMGVFKSLSTCITGEVKKVIVGKDTLIQDILIALLSEGNIMLDGVPGLAKTSIAKAFAATLDLDFKRLQFVPDILPSDITGTYVYNQNDSSFSLKKGPIFTNILLVDEVNRASPKTQSSLLEAMEEKQVSIDGTTMPLPYPFMVITTQNPIDIIGTFPLPEAQIDRFMFKLNVDYPTPEEELDILKAKNENACGAVERVLAADDVVNLINIVRQVHVDDKVIEYIRDLILASRSHEKILLGGSPRASIALLKASKAVAAIDGRDYVIPDDIKYLAPRILNHRLIIKPEYEFENITTFDIIEELLNTVKIPA